MILTLPVFEDESFAGIIDLVSMKYQSFTGGLGDEITTTAIPEEYQAEADQWRLVLLEKIAENSITLMELYYNDEVIPDDLLLNEVRNSTIAGNIVPVICGSSYRNIGVQTLLDAIVNFLPSPLDIEAAQAIDLTTDQEFTISPDNKEFFSALIFKIVSDRHVGKLAFAGFIPAP